MSELHTESPADTGPLTSSTGDSVCGPDMASHLTQNGFLVGSPGYMAPEQFHGTHVTIGPASDIYSLAVVLYQMLTGQLPFPGEGNIGSVVSSIFFDTPPDLSTLRPEVSQELAFVCQKAMARKARDRYSSMLEFSTALADIHSSEFGNGNNPTNFRHVQQHEEIASLRSNVDSSRPLIHSVPLAEDTSPIANAITAHDMPVRFKRRKKRDRYYKTVSITVALTIIASAALITSPLIPNMSAAINDVKPETSAEETVVSSEHAPVPVAVKDESTSSVVQNRFESVSVSRRTDAATPANPAITQFQPQHRQHPPEFHHHYPEVPTGYRPPPMHDVRHPPGPSHHPPHRRHHTHRRPH